MIYFLCKIDFLINYTLLDFPLNILHITESYNYWSVYLLSVNWKKNTAP